MAEGDMLSTALSMTQWLYESTSAPGAVGGGDAYGMQTSAMGSNPVPDGGGNAGGPVTPRPCKSYCDMDYDTAMRILYVINVIIIPSISIFGVFGSISSMMVLARQGVKSSSSVLLMAVSISDLTSLIGNNNILFIWKGHFKHRVSYATSEALYGTHLVQIFMYELGLAMSVFVTVLITLERVVAVYLPLKKPTLITTKRTVIAVASCLPIAAFKALMGAMYRTLAYNERKQLPRLVKSDFFRENEDLYYYTRQIWDYIIGLIPVLTVLIGSIVIGIGIKLAARRRAKLMSSGGGDKSGKEKKSSGQLSKTTSTLLAICIQFTLTLGVGFLIETFVPDVQTWQSYIWRFRANFVLYTINASSNFLIYVVINKNFRQIYLSMLMPWRYKDTGKKVGKA